MLSSVTDRERDVNMDKLDALRPENIDKNRFKDIVPCTRLLIMHGSAFSALTLLVVSVPYAVANISSIALILHSIFIIC